MKTAAQRFATNVILPTDPNGCWEWRGHKVGGYGRIADDPVPPSRTGRGMGAYRWAYLRFVGDIPPGLVLDHFACDNPGCVNPAHVRPVTPRENVMRGQGACANNARKTHCVRGHPLTEDNLISSKQGRVCRRCGSARRVEAKLRSPSRHGTTNAYATYGCRCDLCRAAWAAYKRRTSARRRASANGSAT